MNERQKAIELLISERKKLGLSQRQLGKIMYLDSSEISRIENNKIVKPELDTLVKYNYYLHIDLKYLLETFGYKKELHIMYQLFKKEFN